MNVNWALGKAKPMAHQAEDVERFRFHRAVNLFNDLGTGKTLTAVWLAAARYLDGLIDAVLVVAPGMCIPDWLAAFSVAGMPSELVEVVDGRPPNHNFVHDAVLGQHSARLLVVTTTHAGVRSWMESPSRIREKQNRRGRGGLSGYSVRTDLESMTGRRVMLIIDEAHMAAGPKSSQGIAISRLAAKCTFVVSATASPEGNPLQLRWFGMTRLTRPDLLKRPAAGKMAGRAAAGSFSAFQSRYAVMSEADNGPVFPVAVRREALETEVLGPMAPITTSRRKAECVDLPPKVRMVRTFTLPPNAEVMMRDLVTEDRAILDDGSDVTITNTLERRLRTMELCGGWLSGKPVHDAKLQALKEVVEEVTEAEGPAPMLVWAVRTIELLGAALVLAGVDPPKALGWAVQAKDRPLSVAEWVAGRGVGIIHGPTPETQRVELQERWKRGEIRFVVAHPAVAGAGLNWQHVVASVYYGQPLGVTTRLQSEDRVHRTGLKHTALYYDLVLEGGPDQAAAQAHSNQRDAAAAVLDWLRMRATASPFSVLA